MKIRSRAARRYAKALHDLATDSSALDAVSADMAALQGLLADSRDLLAFAGNYLIPSGVRAGILSSLFADRLHSMTWKFIRFMELKRRLGLLEEVSADFMEQEEVRRGVVRGSLSSAFPVAPAEALELAGQLGRRLRQTLLLKTEENPGLLGGCRLQVGDMVYDFSLAARLRMLRQTMMAG
jgi:F-type H+-transporting ATPase subunit delta